MPSPVFFDLSARAKLRLHGTDRVRFLNGQVTNDVRRLAGGGSLYACVVTAKGRLCADVFITAGADFLQLDAEVELRESLAARLERYVISDDVEITDVSDGFGLLHLPGGGGAVEGWAAPVELTAGASRFGAPGSDLSCETAALPAMKALLAGLGYREGSTEEAERLRIIAGVPRWGAELDENTLPPEAGLESRAISYEKGCYVGQEVISRLKSVGHVNRHLRRLRASAPLTPGATLHPADDPTKEVGRVTSAVLDAAGDGGGGCLALGYVRRGSEAPGTRLRTASGEVEVVGPPLSGV